MAAPDLYDPNPVGIDPATLSRFDALCSRMSLIAEAVNAFNNPTLQERAFHELVSIINPVEDEQDEDSAAARHSLDQLANWLHVNLPDDAARIDDTLNHTAVDVAIDLLREFRQSLLTRQEKVDDRAKASS